MQFIKRNNTIVKHEILETIFFSYIVSKIDLSERFLILYLSIYLYIYIYIYIILIKYTYFTLIKSSVSLRFMPFIFNAHTHTHTHTHTHIYIYIYIYIIVIRLVDDKHYNDYVMSPVVIVFISGKKGDKICCVLKIFLFSKRCDGFLYGRERETKDCYD